MIKTRNVVLPAFYAPALINGDMSGYSDAELKDIAVLQKNFAKRHEVVVSVDSEPISQHGFFVSGLWDFGDGRGDVVTELADYAVQHEVRERKRRDAKQGV